MTLIHPYIQAIKPPVRLIPLASVKRGPQMVCTTILIIAPRVHGKIAPYISFSTLTPPPTYRTTTT
jgi:hypothetical protein